MSSSIRDSSAVAHDLAAIVRRWWSAVEGGDVETVADMLTDDMTWEVMHVGEWMPNNGVFKGKAQVQSDLLSIMNKIYYIPGQTTFKITAMYIADPVVVFETTINATTAKGRKMEDAKYISIMTIENGKIKYVREYPDALKAKAAHLD